MPPAAPYRETWPVASTGPETSLLCTSRWRRPRSAVFSHPKWFMSVRLRPAVQGGCLPWLTAPALRIFAVSQVQRVSSVEFWDLTWDGIFAGERVLAGRWRRPGKNSAVA